MPMERIRGLKVRNKLGLHARAAGKIVETGTRYTSRLFLKKHGQEVEGNNILSILTLCCPKGTEVQARIVGEDADLFMKELERLFEDRFGERP